MSGGSASLSGYGDVVSNDPSEGPNAISPRTLSRMKRESNLERSPEGALLAQYVARSMRASGDGHEGNGDGHAEAEAQGSRAAFFSPLEAKRIRTSYNAAVAAAADAAEISDAVQDGIDNTYLMEAFRRAKVNGVEYAEMFRIMDREGTGTMDRREFCNVLKSIALADPTANSTEFEKLADHYTASSGDSGRVDYNAFLQDMEGFEDRGVLSLDAEDDPLQRARAHATKAEAATAIDMLPNPDEFSNSNAGDSQARDSARRSMIEFFSSMS